MCDQIHLIRREFRRRFSLPVETRLSLHHPRPIPHLPGHGQTAGIAERRNVVPHLEFLAMVAMEPQQGGKPVDRRRTLGLESAAGHLAARAAMMAQPLVGVSGVLARHVDTNHKCPLPAAPWAGRRIIESGNSDRAGAADRGSRRRVGAVLDELEPSSS